MIYNNPFLIVEVSPAHNEMSVPVNNGAMVRFSMDMNVNTINTGTFLLREVNGSAVESVVTYDRGTRKAFLKPALPLQAGIQYRLTILGGDAGIKTATDTKLPETKHYEFTTTSDVLISLPKNVAVVDTGGHHTVSWQQPDIYDASKDLTYKVAISTSALSPQDDPGAVVWPLATDSIKDPSFTSIAVSRHLAPHNYYAYVQAYIGTERSPWASTQFLVEAPVVGGGNNGGGNNGGGNYLTFEVLDSYPRAGSVHVMPASIKILFSGMIDMSTVTNDSIYVLKKKQPAKLNLIDLMTDYSSVGSIGHTIDPMVQGNLISLTLPADSLEINSEYTIIIREYIRDTSGNTLGEAHSISFNTTFVPFYGDPDLIRDDMRTFLTNIPDKSLYTYIRNTSETALGIVSKTIEFFNEETFNEDIPRYVKEYVRTQTTYDLLINAVLEKSSSAGSIRSLGDLTIDNSKSTSVGPLLAGFKERIKPWLDELHGHHNRGYAKPTVTVRGENIEQYPDFFDRQTFKDIDA